jgi:hypothetical protein
LSFPIRGLLFAESLTLRGGLIRCALLTQESDDFRLASLWLIRKKHVTSLWHQHKSCTRDALCEHLSIARRNYTIAIAVNDESWHTDLMQAAECFPVAYQIA